MSDDMLLYILNGILLASAIGFYLRGRHIENELKESKLALDRANNNSEYWERRSLMWQDRALRAWTKQE